MKNILVANIPDFMKPLLRVIYGYAYRFKYRIIEISQLPNEIIYNLRYPETMFPRESMVFVGKGDFEQHGQIFIRHFIELANLQPNDHVLDVGCGIGRMAIPLTDYLSDEGGYWGFDIVNKGIKWCQNRISPKFSNFHFQHSDVYNLHYNPKGKVKAQNYQFPYDSEFFDFVFLTSVFTHMLPSDVEQYLSEISRVLKTGGKCLITFFILNEDTENLIQSGRTTLDFRHQLEGCSTTTIGSPEAAIAYSEESVLRLFEKYGLNIAQPINYGNWCERDNFFSYQDIIVATKE